MELASSEFLENKNTIPEANKVFIVSSYLDKNSINVLWEIKDGFYLYLNSVQVKKNANIIPYKVIYSEQSTYSDEFFGTTQILRKEFKIEINNSDLLDLSNILIKYQGCSDSGFCYPMQTKQIL
uniref:Thiol:disulfide interchange protein n=1 Tax=uncultured bacterium HF0010_16H03 TaxID=710811 RepID=E0XPC5_9BACT|nr:thiol:disulfide interchange protein [uncultured bacterium HF0010_16H03]